MTVDLELTPSEILDQAASTFGLVQLRQDLLLMGADSNDQPCRFAPHTPLLRQLSTVPFSEQLYVKTVPGASRVIVEFDGGG